MQEASLASPSGMISLIGADESSAEALCERARQGEVLTPANFNCPGQVVISGSKGACQRAVELASEFGCRAVVLSVAGAFHSPLMEPAARGLADVLNETRFRPPVIPVLSNVNADRHRDAQTTRDLLRRQVTQPVLWQRCMERMIEQGAGRFVEIGPGRALIGLARKINRETPAVNISTAEAIPAALKALAVSEVKSVGR